MREGTLKKFGKGTKKLAGRKDTHAAGSVQRGEEGTRKTERWKLKRRGNQIKERMRSEAREG